MTTKKKITDGDGIHTEARCVLEAKVNGVWGIIMSRDCPLDYLENTLEYLRITGDRHFTRHEKTRVRRV